MQSITQVVFPTNEDSVHIEFFSDDSEIIVKAWRVKNSFGKINFFIIGNFNLLKKQLLKMNYKVNIKQISSISNHNFK